MQNVHATDLPSRALTSEKIALKFTGETNGWEPLALNLFFRYSILEDATYTYRLYATWVVKPHANDRIESHIHYGLCLNRSDTRKECLCSNASTSSINPARGRWLTVGQSWSLNWGQCPPCLL